MTDELATLAFERRDGLTVADLSGEVDLSNADRLLAMLVAESEDAPILVLDLTRCSYVDSAGLGAIARLETARRDRGLELRVVVPASTSIDRVLTMTGMHEFLTVDRTLEEALARAGSAAAEPSGD